MTKVFKIPYQTKHVSLLTRIFGYFFKERKKSKISNLNMTFVDKSERTHTFEQLSNMGEDIVRKENFTIIPDNLWILKKEGVEK